jgi:Tfp pilus assembly protein PilO
VIHARPWRRERRLWLPAAIFCAVNLAALVGYRALLAGEGERAERALEGRRQGLATLVAERGRSEAMAALAVANREALTDFYAERLGTEAERLTKTLAEVQELAQRAGLRPSSFQYPNEPIAEFGLVQRAIVFSIAGQYDALRRFVNFLELSESFLTLQEMGLSGRESGTELRISLRLAMLFVREGVDPARLAAERAAAEELGAGP